MSLSPFFKLYTEAYNLRGNSAAFGRWLSSCCTKWKVDRLSNLRSSRSVSLQQMTQPVSVLDPKEHIQGEVFRLRKMDVCWWRFECASGPVLGFGL
mmetsp:Transcript_3732/g.5303  ORF Transcript_3732/g.5303 Transcript_3732/m.5303 type:complete len:96 (+) Transcript_3732:503-790(+)